MFEWLIKWYYAKDIKKLRQFIGTEPNPSNQVVLATEAPIFAGLTDEISLHILSFLNDREKTLIRSVCRQAKRLANDSIAHTTLLNEIIALTNKVFATSPVTLENLYAHLKAFAKILIKINTLFSLRDCGGHQILESLDNLGICKTTPLISIPFLIPLIKHQIRLCNQINQPAKDNFDKLADELANRSNAFLAASQTAPQTQQPHAIELRA